MYTIEKDWYASGLRCVVVMTSLGHRCGYVGVTPQHPLYSRGYEEHCPELIPLWNKIKEEPLGKRSPVPLFIYADGDRNTPPGLVFDVHGNITFAGGDGHYPVAGTGIWWFGFDTDHDQDWENPKSLDYCAAECESLAKQLQGIQASSIQGGPMGSNRNRNGERT